MLPSRPRLHIAESGVMVAEMAFGQLVFFPEVIWVPFTDVLSLTVTSSEACDQSALCHEL